MIHTSHQTHIIDTLYKLHDNLSAPSYEVSDRSIERDGELIEIEAPTHWSDTAVRIMATKYMRRAGVPSEVDFVTAPIRGRTPPKWLAPRRPATSSTTTFGAETSVLQVLRRLAGQWTLQAFIERVFCTADDDEVTNQEDNLLWMFFSVCYRMMIYQIMAPNSPQFFNTGLWWAYGIEGENARYVNPQTSACFILGVEDNLIDEDGIFETALTEARIFKYGSGAGANFSRLRHKDAPLSSGGKSSGLISFLKILDTAAGAIKSGGTTRRAAKMVVVDADHPDAMEFARLKAVEELKIRALQFGVNGAKSIDPHYSKELDALKGDWESGAHDTVGFQNANHSIRWTDAQIRAAQRGLNGAAEGPEDDRYAALWFEQAYAAHACGDPGIQFDSMCNEWHTIPKVARQRATNPCSEYSFIDNSACNLASVNLMKFYDPGNSAFDAEFYGQVCAIVTLILDLTVGMSSYPTEKIRENSLKYRTLGLGYTNLGALLMAMGLPYASYMGQRTAAALTALMHGHAWQMSHWLADVLSPFHDFETHHDDVAKVLNKHKEYVDLLADEIANAPGQDDSIHAQLTNKAQALYRNLEPRVRNAQLTLLAPTGTISFIMDCDTTGIEPDFALVKTKILSGGGTINQINQTVPVALGKMGYTEAEITEAMRLLAEDGVEAFMAVLKPENRDVFKTANTIHWRDHIRMMGAVQPFLSGAISKTVNMPNEATVEDVSDAYIMAWRSGLKAIAIYRDGCKVAQPMRADKKPPASDDRPETETNLALPAEELRSQPALPRNQARIRLNDIRRGTTVTARIGGYRVYLRTGEYEDGRIGEIFLTIAKAGSHLRAYLDALAIAVSIGLQHGVPINEYIDAFQDIKCDPSGIVSGDGEIAFCTSVLDWVARVLKSLISDQHTEVNSWEMPPIDPNYSFAPDAPTTETSAGTLEVVNLGDACPNCGYFTLQRAGTCMTCSNCGWTGGCS